MYRRGQAPVICIATWSIQYICKINDFCPYSFDSDGFKNYQKGLKSELFDRIVNLIKELNLDISDDNSLGKGFKIGHSYLCGIEQKDCTKELLEEIVKYDILPMLQEYWFDNQDKVERWSKKFLSLFE